MSNVLPAQAGKFPMSNDTNFSPFHPLRQSFSEARGETCPAVAGLKRGFESICYDS